MLTDGTVNANVLGQLPVPENIIQGKRLSTEHKVRGFMFSIYFKINYSELIVYRALRFALEKCKFLLGSNK